MLLHLGAPPFHKLFLRVRLGWRRALVLWALRSVCLVMEYWCPGINWCPGTNNWFNIWWCLYFLSLLPEKQTTNIPRFPVIAAYGRGAYHVLCRCLFAVIYNNSSKIDGADTSMVELDRWCWKHCKHICANVRDTRLQSACGKTHDFRVFPPPSPRSSQSFHWNTLYPCGLPCVVFLDTPAEKENGIAFIHW